MTMVGVLQVVAGLLLLLRPSRAVVVATVVGTVLVFAVYVASRTVGVPFGPMPWQPEEVGAVDLASKATELALLLAMVWLLGAGQRARDQLRGGEGARGGAARAD